MTKKIYKEPISVICIQSNGSKKLIKDCIYLATSLTGNISNPWRYLYIKGLGSYQAKFFSTLDGISMNDFEEFTTQQNYVNRIRPELDTDYTGQYVRCVYSASKFLKEGEIYFVEKQFRKSNRTKYNFGYYEYDFKLKNIKNKVNSWNFQEIPLTEQRNIKLKTLDGLSIKTGDMSRKFLLYTEQEKTTILFDILSKTLIDISFIQNKTNIKNLIVDMMFIKGKKYDLLKEEIELFLSKNINDLINM